METSRRDFIRTLGVSGLAALSLPKIISAANSFESSEGIHNDKGATFLFQGDSITDGNRTRDKDWNHIMGHRYAYLIASRLWFDYPDRDFMFYNRGIGGNRVRDLNA